MTTCPYCQTTLIDGNYFCGECEQQVKCRGCDARLEANKTLCLKCGKRLVSSDASPTPLNQFSLEEHQTTDSYSRRIDLRATDDAIGQIAPLLGGTVNASRRVPPPTVHSKPLFSNTTLLQDGASVVLDQASADEETSSASANVTSAAQYGQHNNQFSASHFFQADGDNGLVALVTDYKGKTRKANQQRFILLYVWAYQSLLGKPVSLKDALTPAAKRQRFWDGNFARYLSDAKRLLLPMGDGYKLNKEGEAEVHKIIADISNDDQSANTDKRERSKTTRKRSPLGEADEQLVEQWIAMPIDIGGFDVGSLGNPKNHALFAYWAITKRLRAAEVVKPRVAYAYLVRRFPKASVDLKPFTDTLSRPHNKELFGANSQGQYYLKEQGERLIESMIKGQGSQSAPSEEKDDNVGSEGDEQ